MAIKIACISDTHNQHYGIEIPECDILIHAGDFSYQGKAIDILELDHWFGKLKASGKVKEIVAIAGNHDWLCERDPSLAASLFKNCIYLNEQPAEVMGLKFFGSPIQPEFCNWAFNRQRGAEIARHWAKIPDDTQVLITHGPPFDILDKVWDRPYNSITGPDPLGCKDLRIRVDELEHLKLHVFGHIHDSNGQYIDQSTGKMFINAAICSEEYKPIQKVHLIELK